jgi:hypothetical protein
MALLSLVREMMTYVTTLTKISRILNKSLLLRRIYTGKLNIYRELSISYTVTYLSTGVECTIILRLGRVTLD